MVKPQLPLAKEGETTMCLTAPAACACKYFIIYATGIEWGDRLIFNSPQLLNLLLSPSPHLQHM